MTKEQKIKESVEEFKEVIGVKLKHYRDLETNVEGNYHILYKGWNRLILGLPPKGYYEGSDPDYIEAVRNLEESIKAAVDLSQNEFDKTMKGLLDEKEAGPSFFFLASLIANLTILYAIIEIQNCLFKEDTTVIEKRDMVKRMVINKFGNEIMYELIFPAFNYYFKKTCPKQYWEVTKEKYYVAMEAMGSKICSSEGMKVLFEPLLR